MTVNICFLQEWDKKAFVTETLTGNTLESYDLKLSQSYPLHASFSQNQSFILIGDNRDNLIQIDRLTKNQKTFTKGFSSLVHPLSVSTDAQTNFAIEDYKSAYLINSISLDTVFIDFEKPYNYSFSPDGKAITIASAKLFASIFNIETGKEIHKLIPNPENKCDGCNPKITYSHDGKTIVMYDRYNGITFWNSTSGKLLFTIKNTETRFDELSFSEDDKLLLVSSDELCEIIEISSKKSIFSLETRLFSNFLPVFSPNSKSILTPGELNTIVAYSIQSGKPIKKYKGFFNEKKNDNLKYLHERWTDVFILNLLKHKSPFEISTDGNTLIQGKVDTSIVLTNLNNGKTINALKGHKQQVFTTAINPNGKELLTGDGAGKIIQWDLETGEIKHTYNAHFDIVFDICFNQDGSEMVSSSWDGTIKHWDLIDHKLIGTIDTEQAAAYKVSFSNRDLYILSCGLDQKVHFYETDSKQLVRSLTGHTNTIADLSLLNNGKQIATVSWDGYLKIWDFQSAMLIDKIKTPGQSALLSLAYDSTSGLIYCGSLDRNIHVYDINKEN